jgi:hypothetical protein
MAARCNHMPTPAETLHSLHTHHYTHLPAISPRVWPFQLGELPIRCLGYLGFGRRHGRASQLV